MRCSLVSICCRCKTRAPNPFDEVDAVTKDCLIPDSIPASGSPNRPVRSLSRGQSFAQVARESQSEKGIPFQAWTVVPSEWGGGLPPEHASPIVPAEQPSETISQPLLQKWLNNSEKKPLHPTSSKLPHVGSPRHSTARQCTARDGTHLKSQQHHFCCALAEDLRQNTIRAGYTGVR
jgi:hypothetical protein